MLRGKGGRSDSKTPKAQQGNELTMEQLDQVAGGAATTPPLKDEHVLAPMMGPPLMAPPVIAVSVSSAPHDAPAQQTAPLHIDLIEMTASTAATQLNTGTIDAAHAIGHVEAYAASHHQADVTGLTDLLNSSNGNKDVAASLSAELHNGAAEANLASQVKSGFMSPENAVKELERAIDTLTKFAPEGDKPVTDGLFEMSVAHLYNAARDQGNTELQDYLGRIHGFDVKSGWVQIESDHAAADLAAGRITVNDAIAHTIDVANQQGLPKDVALTALLVDTHGNATVAQQLGAYVNDTTGFSAGALSNDIANAVNKNNMAPEDAVESIREAVDALARYAPTRLVGPPDMNFAEALTTLKYGACAQNADLQKYLTQHHSFDLAVGAVCLAVEQGGFSMALQYADQQGLPRGMATCATLAHQAGTPAAANTAAMLADNFNRSSWGTPSSFAVDLQNLMANTQQSDQNPNYMRPTPAHVDVEKAISLIHMVVDTLAKYAPEKVEGNANLNACEVMYSLQWGRGANTTYAAELNKNHAYEMKLGEVANAAQYGVTYASAYAASAPYHPEGIYTGEFNAKYWSDKNGTPQVYGLIATMGDVSPTAKAVIAQQIADGLANGQFERDAANLVKAGKITAAQAVESITAALEVCTRFGKQPLGMPADVARAYVLDTLRDEAGTTGAKALTDHVNANFANDLKLGDQVDAYLNAHPQAAKTADAGFLALTGQLHNQMTQAQIQADLTSGHSTIQDVMKSQSMSASQAESLLFTMANNGTVPKQVVFAQLESLMTSEKLSPTQVIADIRNAVTGHSISADAGVLLLAGLSDRSVQAQQAAGAAINAMVASGQVSVGVVLGDIYNGVASHALSDAEGIAALAMLNASTNAQLRDGGTSLITSLVQTGHVEVATAIAGIHNAATAGLMSPAAASSTLLTLGQNGDAKAQLAVGAELGKLLSPADATTRIHESVVAHRVSADTALSVLSGLGQGGAAAQTAANAEVVRLVTSGQTTADNAMATLTTLATNNTGTQSAVNGEIAALVAAKLTTADHAVEVLARLGAGASEAKQTAIEEEISALVAAKHLTADQACNKLCAMANAGAPAMQAFSGEVIASLVAHKLIDSNRAMQDVAAALAPSSRPWGTPAYWAVATSIMAEGNADLRGAAAYQAANFMRSYGYNANTAMVSAIESATAADAMTGAQAATALGCLAAQFPTNNPYDNSSGFLTAIGQELGNLVAHHEVTASQAMLQVVHAQPSLSVATLMALAGNNSSLQAGVGAALAIYATEPGHSNFSVVSAISQGGGSVALWSGVAAYATGDLQKTAQETLSLVIFGGWSQENGNQWPQYYNPMDTQNVVTAFTSIGMSDDPYLKKFALQEIGEIASRNGVDYVVSCLIKSAGHSAEGQAFVGAGVAAMVAAGADPKAVVGNVAGDSYHRGLPVAEALSILNIAGDAGTGRLRNAIADAILDRNLVPPAQMQTYLSQHLSDGIAEAIVVERVSRGEIAPSQAIVTLNGIIDTFVKANPAVDRPTLLCVALAHLDLATHAASAIAKSLSLGNSPWGNSYTPETGRLDGLQTQINTTENLPKVLTGLGALQFAQTTPGGTSEISNMAHVAMVDFTKLAGSGWSAAESAAKSAANFFTSGVDLLASGDHPNKVAYILKNEVMAHPENYHSWINVGAEIASGPVVSHILNAGAADVGMTPAMIFTLTKLSTGLVADAFESDAIIQAYGKDGAMSISGPARMVNTACSAVTDMVSGVIRVGATSAVDMSIGIYNTFKDIHEGRNATQSAQTMGNNMLQMFSGIQSYDVKDTSVAFGNMWGDIFTGQNASSNASSFGTGLGNILYTNNAYMQAAQTALVDAGNSIAKTAVSYGGSVANISTTAWNETASWTTGAANTVANAFKSY